MLEIKNTEVYGIERAMLVSGYPHAVDEIDTVKPSLDRLKKLGKCDIGSGHDVSLSGVIVQYDLKAPLYFWKQFQRYHFHQINSSMSSMHSIHKINLNLHCNEYVESEIIILIEQYQKAYNDNPNHDSYMRLIANIPSGFELWAGITSNYQQEKTILSQRKNHKLDEWKVYCKWILELPYFKELTGIDK